MSRLQKLDLQLLAQLDMLLRERHVSRAASNLGLSQPAMSAALARLRKLFDDPLLTRTPSGMMPTPRALEIMPHIRQAKLHLDAALQAPAFDPSIDHRSFSITVSDLIGPIVLPRLLALSRQAPGIQFEIWPSLPHTTRERLEDGSYDLSIGDRELIADGLRYLEIARQPLCVIGGEHHAGLFARGLSLEDYARLPHAIHFGRGGRKAILERGIDAVLARRQLSRRETLRVPSLLYAAMAVEESELLATVPKPLGQEFLKRWALTLADLPFDMPPRSIVLAWHERSQSDAGHVWLRREIQAMLEPRKGGEDRHTTVMRR